MMACLLCRIGIHTDVRYGAVSARWQGLGTWHAGLIKLSHDYCNLIGSHNIPRLHTESRLQSPDVLSLLERLARETSMNVCSQCTACQERKGGGDREREKVRERERERGGGGKESER